MKGFEVKYLGGLNSKAPKRGSTVWLLFGTEGLALAVSAAFGISGAKSLRVDPWENLQVDIEDTGQTRANVSALVAFGVLGLGSRKSVTTISVAYPEGTAYFETAEISLQKWRVELAPFLQTDRAAATAVCIGPRPTPAPEPQPAATSQDPSARMRKLAELRDAGLISEEEFKAKRQQLLDLL